MPSVPQWGSQSRLQPAFSWLAAPRPEGRK